MVRNDLDLNVKKKKQIIHDIEDLLEFKISETEIAKTESAEFKNITICVRKEVFESAKDQCKNKFYHTAHENIYISSPKNGKIFSINSKDGEYICDFFCVDFIAENSQNKDVKIFFD